MTTPNKKESEAVEQRAETSENEDKFVSVELENDRKFDHVSGRQKEDFVFFWNDLDIYSQRNMSSFVVNGQKFVCVEQYTLYQKAMLFEDRWIADKILGTSDPTYMKKLGRQVKGFSARVWEMACLYIVKYGNMAKFQQNEGLKKKLFSTFPRILVKASPYDKIWGIGLKEDDHRAWNLQTWQGSNWLGLVITEVRNQLMCEEGHISSSKGPIYVAKIAEGIHKKWLRIGKDTSGDGPSTWTSSRQSDQEAVTGAVQNQHQDDLYVFFWKRKDIFSQWHESFFEKDDQYFTCAEQFMMYKKADTFGNTWVKQQIMKAETPREMKALGRKLTGHGYKNWNNICQEVVKSGNMAKFSQNSDMKEALFSTYPKTLVEASPHDTKWGIGLEETDPRAHDQSTWKGQNLLGYILTEVRDELMCKEGLISEEQRMIFIQKDTGQGESFLEETVKLTPTTVSEEPNMENSGTSPTSVSDDSDCEQGEERKESYSDQDGGTKHSNKTLQMTTGAVPEKSEDCSQGEAVKQETSGSGNSRGDPDNSANANLAAVGSK